MYFSKYGEWENEYMRGNSVVVCLAMLLGFTAEIVWRHAKQHVSFINFKLLEFYWTYLLAFQTTTPKISPRILICLDHKPKMRWHTSGFVVIFCKYGLLLKKLLAMSVREVIWAVSFNSLLKPGPYVDVDDIIGYDPNWWKGNWTMNPPFEVRISRAMWAQSM